MCDEIEKKKKCHMETERQMGKKVEETEVQKKKPSGEKANKEGARWEVILRP